MRNCINMFTNLLIEVLRFLSSTLSSKGEVCHRIFHKIIYLNLELEIYKVYEVQWNKGSHKLFVIQP